MHASRENISSSLSTRTTARTLRGSMAGVIVAMIASVGLSAGSAWAQGPAGGPWMPVGLDLGKVPLGSWGEYRVEIPGQPGAFKQRLALVGREAVGHVVEMAVEGGPLGAGRPVLVKVVVDPDIRKAERVRKVVMQFGSEDPMEMPVGPQSSQGQFNQIDPKKLVGQETIAVPAGSFKTKRYRDTRDGVVVDAWVSEDVPPFGLVKLESSKGTSDKSDKKVTMVLIDRGKGAKAAVTKPARPFDQMALMRFFQGMGAGGAAAGGKPASTRAAPAGAPPSTPAAGTPAASPSTPGAGKAAPKGEKTKKP